MNRKKKKKVKGAQHKNNNNNKFLNQSIRKSAAFNKLLLLRV